MLTRFRAWLHAGTSIGPEFRFAFRRLRAAPVSALLSMASLALGIGAVTAIYSLLYSLLWRSGGVADPDRILDLHANVATGSPALQGRLSWADFQDYAAQQTTFSSLAAWAPFSPAVVTDDVAELGFGEAVNADYFRTFGVTAKAGRTIGPADLEPGAPPVVVLSERFVRTKLGSDSSVLGRVLKIGGHPFEVAGVVPDTFAGSGMFMRPTDLWTSLESLRTLPRTVASFDFDPAARTRHWLQVKGRLAPGRTPDDAAREAGLIGRRLEAAFPTPKPD